MIEVERILFSFLTKHLDNPKILIIRGPRRSGKTFLLNQLKEFLIKEKGIKKEKIIFYNADDEETRFLWETSEKTLLKKLLDRGRRERIFVFFDEFQRVKKLSERIKFLHDSCPKAKFILSGSSSLVIAHKTSESLMGRAETFLLHPFSFGEFLQTKSKKIESLKAFQDALKKFLEAPSPKRFLKLKEDFNLLKALGFDLDVLEDYFLIGGYPEADLSTEPFFYLKQIKDAYIEKDILKEFKILNWENYEKTMKYFALTSGSLFNRSLYAREIGIAQETLKKFINLLKGTYILGFLPVFRTNRISSLKKAQKPYFYDLGLRNLLANTINKEVIAKEKGLVLENFFYSQLKKFIAYQYQDLGVSLYFWRNEDKNEVDFILERGREILPIEVKEKNRIEKGFWIFLGKMKIKKGIVIGNDFALQKRKNIQVFFLPKEAVALLV